MGLLRWWFVGLLLTFPLGAIIRIQVVPQAYVYPIDIFVIVTVLYSLYVSLVARKSVMPRTALSLFIGVAFVALLFNIFWLDAFVIAAIIRIGARCIGLHFQIFTAVIYQCPCGAVPNTERACPESE